MAKTWSKFAKKHALNLNHNETDKAVSKLRDLSDNLIVFSVIFYNLTYIWRERKRELNCFNKMRDKSLFTFISLVWFILQMLVGFIDIHDIYDWNLSKKLSKGRKST